MAAKGFVKCFTRIERESYHGYLMPLLTCEASIHRQGNGDARVGIAIRAIADVGFGECVNGHRVVA
jgi:hypothetical protein